MQLEYKDLWHHLMQHQLVWLTVLLLEEIQDFMVIQGHNWEDQMAILAQVDEAQIEQAHSEEIEIF